MAQSRHNHGGGRSAAPVVIEKDAPVAAQELDRLEIHRQAVALMPSPQDHYPAVAIGVVASAGRAGQHLCSCRRKGHATCEHLKQLARIQHAVEHAADPTGFNRAFKASVWHQLAVVLTDGGRPAIDSIELLQAGGGQDDGPIVVQDRQGQALLRYRSTGPDRLRLIERLTFSSKKKIAPTRADVLDQLARLTVTDDEQVLQARGFKTTRRLLEEGFWYRFAYHCLREFGPDRLKLHPFIDEAGGDFLLDGRDADAASFFQLILPRQKVKRVLKELSGALTNQHGLTIQPLSLEAVFDVTLNDDLDMEIRPLHRLIRKNGEIQFFKREDLAKYQYGDLYYIKELGMLVEDHYPAPRPKYLDPVRTLIDKSRIPQFLAEHGADLQQPYFRLNDAAGRLQIIDAFDSLVITPEALERDWCWISIQYGQGDLTVSLADVLRAKMDGQRFLATASGWVDCQSEAFDYLDDMIDRNRSGWRIDNQRLGLARPELLRLLGVAHERMTVSGAATQDGWLHKMLELKPLRPTPHPSRLVSDLRAYQQRGAEWLWFLYENRFGGLLCDDMGLGKTHQVMAFMAALQEQKDAAPKPFLVVCPTSVISHWQQKLVDHVPGLSAAVYHGGERDAQQALHCDVVITSYGVLLRDSADLADVDFSVIFFDEIQQIKNAHTKSYQAAAALKAEIKIGLTGTPIENRLQELKSLLDLTIPGYLGSDEAFARRYRLPIEEHHHAGRIHELGRLIAPFVLRRLKKSVLLELPSKIEDLRSCVLSREQIKLYRDAIDSRGRELLHSLASEEVPVPYIHIFALLTLLKQICNHPALVNGHAYSQHASGKWDLFTELLTEALDSGQKVVVYSQYVGMVAMIKHYLDDQNISSVLLTGASRQRGAIIRRFNEDPDCRVFVGSLKAGGVGIDLVAAAVVIHYDRWWNAAREDQATDRVHRIGQTRGVQVFKLVTQGTLEEKIAAIIARKKDFMNNIIREDDPDLVKSFSRSELMDMLALPQAR